MAMEDQMGALSPFGAMVRTTPYTLHPRSLPTPLSLGIQGYLAHKTPPYPSILQYAYA